jgi:malate dehydrogenase (oxaloacetate-decarboxylating)
VVFALANPIPEVDAIEASRHAAVVATISTSVLLAASRALAAVVNDSERNPAYIVPSVFHPEVTQAVAGAVERAGRDEGLAGHVQRQWHDSRAGSVSGRDRV